MSGKSRASFRKGSLGRKAGEMGFAVFNRSRGYALLLEAITPFGGYDLKGTGRVANANRGCFTYPL